MRDNKISKISRTNKKYEEKDILDQVIKTGGTKRQKLLGLFLVFVFLTFLAKVVESILLDLGLGINGEIHLSWWKDEAILASEDPRILNMLATRPHTFWIFTQFTWLTTIIIMIYLFLRYFKYDENVPSWLRWVLSPRSLTLLAAYDTVVAIIFWAGMADGFVDNFSPFLLPFEITLTVIVHAVIPVFIVTYAIFVQVTSARASMLREGYIIRGMVYPVIYLCYYIVMSVTWYDPYPVTNIQEDLVGNLYLLPLALLAVYIILGVFMVIQNGLLLRFNKNYEPTKDFGVSENKRIEIQKAKEIAKRKFARTYLHKEEEAKKKIAREIKIEEEKKKEAIKERKHQEKTLSVKIAREKKKIAAKKAESKDNRKSLSKKKTVGKKKTVAKKTTKKK